MYPALLAIISGALLLAWLAYLTMLIARARRRNQLRRQPLSEAATAFLKRNVPLYSKLPRDLKERHRRCVNLFLAEKKFIGCAGLEVTQEMRVTIAGHACLLLLNARQDFFRNIRSILIYPDAYIAPQEHWDESVLVEGHEVRAGESWEGGPVILSWQDIRAGLEHPEDGYNVILHEFAHKLDEELAGADGLPLLPDGADYAEWARVMTQEFSSLLERVARGENDVLDAYASGDPAEFFAVATETFFEQGAALQRRLPELYRQLQQFYGADPAGWSQTAGKGAP